MFFALSRRPLATYIPYVSAYVLSWENCLATCPRSNLGGKKWKVLRPARLVGMDKKGLKFAFGYYVTVMVPIHTPEVHSIHAIPVRIQHIRTAVNTSTFPCPSISLFLDSPTTVPYPLRGIGVSSTIRGQVQL